MATTSRFARAMQEQLCRCLRRILISIFLPVHVCYGICVWTDAT